MDASDINGFGCFLCEATNLHISGKIYCQIWRNFLDLVRLRTDNRSPGCFGPAPLGVGASGCRPPNWLPPLSKFWLGYQLVWNWLFFETHAVHWVHVRNDGEWVKNASRWYSCRCVWKTEAKIKKTAAGHKEKSVLQAKLTKLTIKIGYVGQSDSWCFSAIILYRLSSQVHSQWSGEYHHCEMWLYLGWLFKVPFLGAGHLSQYVTVCMYVTVGQLSLPSIRGW